MNFDRPKRGNSHVNVVPLINVIFLLLIFFMVAGRVDKLDMFEIALPVTSSDFDEATKPPVLYFSAEGSIAVNDDLVSREDLHTIIAALLLESPGREMVIKSDGKVPAEQLIWVMDVIEQAGGRQISLITQSTKP